MRQGRRGRQGGRRAGWALSMVLGVGLALLCIVAVERRMEPALLAFAQDQVSRRVTGVVSAQVEAALADEGLSYGDMVALQRDDRGRITAITTDPVAMNGLRNAVLSGVTRELSEVSREMVEVPVGSLTSWDLLAGRGPAVRVGVLSSGAGTAEFHSDFSDAGVNQTRHRIDLQVTVTVTLLLPGQRAERQVTAQVPVAETVVVGETPQQYFSMGTSEP